MKLGYKSAWLLLLLAVAIAFAFIFIPVYLIQPFAPQTERALAISYFLKSWSPIVTPLLAIGVIGLVVVAWKNSKRWYSKAPLVLPIFLSFVFAWFAQQNHFEWMFNPLPNPAYAKAVEASFVSHDDRVMAVTIGGESVAYPIRIMAYHHLVDDTVGGTPITATY